MKLIKYTSTLILLIAGLTFTSCEDFLEEENYTAITIETANTDSETFDQLLAYVYEISRENTTRYVADMYYVFEDLGTDVVTRGGSITGTDEINDYVNVNPSTYAYQVYWGNQYAIISAANVLIDNAETIEGVSETTKTTGVGEAKFFRAWSYFKLAENYGGVPLVLNQVTTAVTDFSRNTEEEVYTQIVTDLEDALASVADDPSEYGKVSKDAVRFLMSKVLLTRAYKSFGSSSDFTEAASLAETIISSYSLVGTFEDLVDVGNQRNSEVVFAYLFGDNSVSRGWGNSRHMMYKFRYFDYPGMTRGDNYQKGLGPALTPFYYSLFTEEDERAEATYRRVIYAEEDSEDGTILAGDTAIFFPKVAWSDSEIAAVPYAVINPDDYFANDGTTEVHYPMFKKFDNPGVPFTQPDQSSQGTRDMVMMRAGEAYLIAAEAYLQLGNASSAAEKINTIRSRAGISTAITESDVDIDFILDERARELTGEANRWMDLKRTSKLIERTLAHNPHAALNNSLTDKHYLRPIPQTEIDITNGTITQNTGY
ncbi:RagB/SusD family nutrient uptake outer membrane protein [Chondrinema litorale]|uniref:RagB/SusD family nutrient uptake outer membrane protein n=1 Tax=Chondrinema litorale TaxID=2994555 RepID=UPI0025437233|nr:RagB/SusD family nutrient uptake outer membrane protein [Chondrinema litorale]UZR99153.1 RagB/SusD family nutrient uptake outer membrane protein [Chondrinema litorale]